MTIVLITGSDSKGHERSLIPLSADFRATILDDVAEFTVTHTFYNDCRHSLPLAEIIFPLQSGFAILDFSCAFGGGTGENKIVRATVMEKVAAQSTFAKARAKGKTAALLEQNAGDVFRSAIGNVPAKARLRTKIVFSGFLHRRIRRDRTIAITVTIPISISPRYGDPPPDWEQKGLLLPPLGLSASLDIITDDYPCATVSRVSKHKVDIDYPDARSRDSYSPEAYGPSRIVVTVPNQHASQKGDIVLDILKGAAQYEAPSAWVEMHPTDRCRYAAMITLPKSVLHTAESLQSSAKRDIVFVTDRSGSMDDKITGLRTALTVFLKGIPNNRHFNVWCFGSTHWAMWPEPVEYNEANLASALASVAKFRADMGGTEIWNVLYDVIKYSAPDRETDVVVLTDGEVSATIEYASLRLVTQAKHDTQGRLRFFALGIGDAVSHALVSGIAQAGGGYSEVIGTSDYDVWEERMAAVLAQTSQEHRGTVQVRVDDQPIIQARDIYLTTRPNPLQSPADLAFLPEFSRSRIFLMSNFDWWTGRAPSTVNLIINNSRGIVVFRENINVRYTTDDQPILHRLAARAAIGDLERGESWIQLHKGAPERGSAAEAEATRQEGVQLGCEWNIVSRWTSFYLEESTRTRDSDPFLDAQERIGRKIQRHKDTEPPEEPHQDTTPQWEDTSSIISSNGLVSSGNSYPTSWFLDRNSLPEVSAVPSHSDMHSQVENTSTGSYVHNQDRHFGSQNQYSIDIPTNSSTLHQSFYPQVQGHSPESAYICSPTVESSTSQASQVSPTPSFSARDTHVVTEAECDRAPPWTNSSLHSTTSYSSATWDANASVENTQDQNYACLSAEDESVLSEIYSQDEKYPSEAPACQLLTELEVYAPACNPAASAAILEDPQPCHTQLSKEAKSQKKIVLKLIDMQKFDGSFHFEDRKAAQKLLGDQFSRLDKALQDLSQLHEYLPHTLATIVLFEQNFHDWFVLFGQSLIKAYAFVDGLVPGAHDRDQWMEYARAKLFSKSKVSKPKILRVIPHQEAEPKPMELEDSEFDRYSNAQEPWSCLNTSELYEAERNSGDDSSKTYSRQKIAKDENFGSNDQDQLSGAVYYNAPEGSSAESNTQQWTPPSTASDSQGQPAEPTYGSEAYYDSGPTYTTGGYGTTTGQAWSGGANDTPLTQNHPDQTLNDGSSTNAASMYSAMAPHEWPQDTSSTQNEPQRPANYRHALDATDYANVINKNTTGRGISVNEQTFPSNGGNFLEPATNREYGNHSSYSSNVAHNITNAPATSQPGASSSLEQLPKSKPKATSNGDSAHGYKTPVQQDRPAEGASSHSSRSHRHGKHKTQTQRHSQGSTTPKESTTYGDPENSNVAQTGEFSHSNWNNQIQDSSKVVDIATDPRKSDRVTPTTRASRHDKYNSGSGNYKTNESQDRRTNQTQDSSEIVDIANDLQESDRITPTAPASRHDKHTSRSSRHSYVDSSKMATTYDYPKIYEEVVEFQDRRSDQTQGSSTTPYGATAPPKSDHATPTPPASRHDKHSSRSTRYSYSNSCKMAATYDYPTIHEEVVDSQDQTQSSSNIPYTATAPPKSESVIPIPHSSLYNEQAPTSSHYSDSKSSKTSSAYDYPKVAQADAEYHHEWDNETYNSSKATEIPIATQRPENSTGTFSSLQYEGYTSSSIHPSHTITATSSSVYDGYTSSSSHPSYSINLQKLDKSTASSSSFYYANTSGSTHPSHTINPQKLDSSTTTSSSPRYDGYHSSSSHLSHNITPRKLDTSTAASSSFYDGYPSSSTQPSHTINATCSPPYNGYSSSSTHSSYTINPQKLDSNTATSSSLQYNDYSSRSSHSTYTEHPNMYTTTEYSSYANSPFPDEEPQYGSATNATLVRRPKEDERCERKREGRGRSEKSRREGNDKGRR